MSRRASPAFDAEGETLRVVCIGSGFGGDYSRERWELQSKLSGAWKKIEHTSLPDGATFKAARKRFNLAAPQG